MEVAMSAVVLIIRARSGGSCITISVPSGEVVVPSSGISTGGCSITGVEKCKLGEVQQGGIHWFIQGEANCITAQVKYKAVQIRCCTISKYIKSWQGCLLHSNNAAHVGSYHSKWTDQGFIQNPGKGGFPPSNFSPPQESTEVGVARRVTYSSCKLD